MKNTEYKETEIGRIPKDWEVKRLGEVCEIRTGGTPSTKEPKYWNGSILWMSSGEINNKRIFATEKKITELGMQNSNASILPSQSVMIALNGQGKTRGTVAVLEVPATCNQSLACLISQKDCYYKYLFFNLENRYIEIRNLTGEKGREGLNLGIVRQIEVPLPPLSEQKKIAEILSTVDSAIEKVQQRIAKTERLKKGLMKKLLTKGIGHKEFKDSELGRIPKDWEVKKLGDRSSFELIMGQSPPSSCVSKQNSTYSFIQGNQEFGYKFVSPVFFTSVGTKVSPINSIIISVRAPVGDVNISLTNICLGRGVAGLIVKGGYTEFIFYYLRNHQEYFNKISKGSTFKGITKDDIEKIPIPLPPLSEQKKIAEILSTVDSNLENQKKQKAKLERVKKGLMKKLLTGEWRVRLT